VKVNHPLVTVGLPVFNGEKFLVGTLDSLLSQEFSDFELIISDNGSADGTQEISRDYASRDDRIIYQRHQHNRGAAWNYSHLVDDASGTYFKWSGHDDLLHPSHLRRCVEEFILAPPSVILCYPKTILIDAEGNEIRRYEDGFDLRDATTHRRVRQLLRNMGLANALFGLIRLDALRKTRRVPAFIDSDLVLLLELALLGQFHELEAPLFYRRIHARQAYQANRTHEDVLRWFDPSRRAGLLLPRSKRVIEMARSILLAPIPAAERARSAAVLAREWGPKYAWYSAREVGDAVRHAARGRRRVRSSV
jgi:glycosyltransferase involved in cell wall biosynthesis